MKQAVLLGGLLASGLRGRRIGQSQGDGSCVSVCTSARVHMCLCRVASVQAAAHLRVEFVRLGAGLGGARALLLLLLGLDGRLLLLLRHSHWSVPPPSGRVHGACMRLRACARAWRWTCGRVCCCAGAATHLLSSPSDSCSRLRSSRHCRSASSSAFSLILSSLSRSLRMPSSSLSSDSPSSGDGASTASSRAGSATALSSTFSTSANLVWARAKVSG